MPMVSDEPSETDRGGAVTEFPNDKSDGEWRFKKRLYRFTWMDTEGSPGQVMTKFPLAQRPE